MYRKDQLLEQNYLTSAPGSKTSAMLLKGESTTLKPGQNTKLSKKKKEYDFAKDKILTHLDLTKPVELGAKSAKLMKNLDNCR